MATIHQTHFEADQNSLSTATGQRDQTEDRCTTNSLTSATLNTLQICSLLPSLKIAVFDCTPEILDPKGHVLDVLSQKAGAEGDVFKLIPFNPQRPNAQAKVTVCKRRNQHLPLNSTRNDILRYSAINEILTFSLCRHSPYINDLLGIAFTPGSEQNLERSWDIVLLMDYAPLGNLESFMGQNPELSGSIRISFARDIFSGIQALHEANLVWGDGKPANVLVFAAPDNVFGYTLKLTDFGPTTSPRVYWETYSFPLGSDMWKSAYSIYWKNNKHTLLPVDKDPEQHSRQCFNFDTFVAGLLLLFLLIGLDKYKKSDVVRLLETASGAGFSSERSFNELGLANAANAALSSHLAELSARKMNSGIPLASMRAVESIFKTTLAWDSSSDMSSLVSLINKCLPSQSASEANNSNQHENKLLIQVKKSVLPSNVMEEKETLQVDPKVSIAGNSRSPCATPFSGSTTKQTRDHFNTGAKDIETPIRGHSVEEICLYLRKHMSSRKLEREVLNCCEKYHASFAWDRQSAHLPKGLELVRPMKANVELGSDSKKEKAPEVKPEVKPEEKPEDSVAVLSSNLEIEKLRALSSSIESSEYSHFSEEGLTPLAYAIQDDNPVVATKRKASAEEGYLDLQMEVVKWLVEKGSDMMNCTIESDTILTWAARHGSFDFFNEVYIWLEENKSTELQHLLCYENIATDGTKWTLLRAAMLRQDTEIFEFVLAKISFEAECERRFEKNFTYLHLCALLEPELGISIANLILKKGKNKYLDEMLATDEVTGLQLSPFALAALKGNMEFACHLSTSNPSFALYSSVIPPTIVPPTDLERWAECRLLPPEKALEPQGWIRDIPYVGTFGELIASLTDTTPGVYSESQLSRELLQPCTGGRMWTTITFRRGWIPWIERKMVKVNHRFLVHYGLNVGFRGPFMHGWLSYRTVLDQLVLEGKQTNAQALTEHLLAGGHVEVVQRAVGEGIRRLYQLQTRFLQENTRDNPERDYEDLLFQATQKIVILMMSELHNMDQKGTTQFFTREIRLDSFTQPDSFFKDGRFIFGLTPESVTSLCHLAVIGGLSELVEMFSFDGQTMIQDGAGRSPLDRALDELDAELIKRKNCAFRHSADREAKLRKIVEHLQSSTKIVTQRTRVMAGTRTSANIFAWSIVLCLIEIFGILWLWRFDRTTCNIYRIGIARLGFLVALIYIFKVMFTEIGLVSALVRRSWWEFLQYGWFVLLIGTEITAVLLLGWIQRVACNYLPWYMYTVSFVLVFALLTWFTICCVLKIPHLCHSIALGFRRAKLLQHLESTEREGDHEIGYQPQHREISLV